MKNVKIIELYQSGKTCREIQELSGIAHQTVHDILIASGVETRKRGPRSRKYPDVKKRRWELDIRRRYGISVEEYEKLLKEQDGVCAVCRKPPTSQNLCVDHAHDKTKRVRGILCKRCNNAIGLLDDNPDAALRLHLYLLTK